MLIHTRELGPFIIKTYVQPEDISPRGQFDDSLIDDVLTGIESGRYEWFCAKVTAEWEGIELASDYLGGCLYESFEQFANGTDYHAQMIDTAIHDAYTRLRELAEKANALLVVAV